jgi:Raf kinase inhibitor-like YbhB/YbcL family protein
MREAFLTALGWLVVVVAGCSGSQPATAPWLAAAPTARQSARPEPTPMHLGTQGPTATRTEAAMQTTVPFGLISTAFEDGSAIPRRFTCDGQDVSPDLSWRGAPTGTAAFVLTATDQDAHDFAHWLVYDLTGSASGGLPEGISGSPDAPPQGLNGFGKIGYGGPCPPSGTHHYRFTLHALDRMLELSGTPTLKELEPAMQGHVLEQTTLTGTYARR